MRALLPLLCAAALLATQPAAATPALPSIPKLLELCASTTMAEATARGERLGWQRLSDTRLEPWRSGFLRHNGGTVEVVGWQRGEKEGEGALSFWIAKGPNAHRACYFSAAGAPGLLNDLSEALGEPDNLDKTADIVLASWTFGPTQVQFAQTGASAVVNYAYTGR
ncbi:hypothetical protein SAMN02745194_03620 [Roseomonas rosea]|uniref:Uncharacterized protein n=1 Tax=Muricoccus roseus TaxID=198092 RepID=A0A1M6MWB0_9PROT|nr:hypothetical protein [Roseomonas rosea]SHJ87737.1 hypothetical protein SAMN02745194_03620 [Roseomonas rosea]